MTKKQEAIERLKRIDVKFFISGMHEVSNYIIDEADKVNNAIETVLSMLKEKDTEIEKKDKIIDLMAEKIFKEGIVWEDKDDVKQYFEKLAERKK